MARFDVANEFLGILGCAPSCVIEADSRQEAAERYVASRDDWTELDGGDDWVAVWVHPLDWDGDTEMYAICRPS